VEPPAKRTRCVEKRSEVHGVTHASYGLICSILIQPLNWTYQGPCTGLFGLINATYGYNETPVNTALLCISVMVWDGVLYVYAIGF
jgi:hypothetical protein